MQAGEHLHDAAARRVAEQREAPQPQRVDERLEIPDVVLHEVGAFGTPRRVAVPAHVEGDDVVVAGERRRDVVERVRVPGDAVEQDHRRLRRVAPFEVVEAEAVHRRDPIGARRRLCGGQRGEAQGRRDDYQPSHRAIMYDCARKRPSEVPGSRGPSGPEVREIGPLGPLGPVDLLDLFERVRGAVGSDVYAAWRIARPVGARRRDSDPRAVPDARRAAQAAWMAALSALVSALVVALAVYGMPVQLAVIVDALRRGVRPVPDRVDRVRVDHAVPAGGRHRQVRDHQGLGRRADRRSPAAGDVHRVLVRRVHRRRGRVRRAGGGVGRDARGPRLLSVLSRPASACSPTPRRSRSDRSAFPVTTLANVTGLPVLALSAMVGRLCAMISVIIPGYLIVVMVGLEDARSKCCRRSSPAACRSRACSSTCRTTSGRS